MRKILSYCVSSVCLVTPLFISAVDSLSTYERAEFYHNHTSFRHWMDANEALAEYDFRGDESILEVGGKDGNISANLAGRIPNGKVLVVGMCGDGAVQFADQNYGKDLYPNLSFSKESFLDSNYENQFDFVVSFYLHWSSDQAAAIKKVYESLKENGRSLFIMPLKVTPEISAIFKEHAARDAWKVYWSNYSYPRKRFTVDEYATFLVEAGFKSSDIKVQEREYLFENKRSLIDWLKRCSIVDPLPEDKVEDFLVDFVNAYAQQYMRPDGQIPYTFNELFIKAYK